MAIRHRTHHNHGTRTSSTSTRHNPSKISFAVALNSKSGLPSSAVHNGQEIDQVPCEVGTATTDADTPLAGFNDALFLDSHGAISEGATWNAMFFDGERAIWPRAEVLPGVTAGLIDTVLKNLGIPSVSRRVRIEYLTRMLAAFALNAVVGVRPIAAIDDLTLPGDDDLAGRLSAGYAQLPAERV